MWTGGERRALVASPVGSTDGIPTGTLLCVPSVKNSGSFGDAPVVAAPTKPWWKSIEIWVVAMLPILDVVAEPLLDYLRVGPRAHHGMILVICCYLAIRRKTSNFVIR